MYVAVSLYMFVYHVLMLILVVALVFVVALASTLLLSIGCGVLSRSLVVRVAVNPCAGVEMFWQQFCAGSG